MCDGRAVSAYRFQLNRFHVPTTRKTGKHHHGESVPTTRINWPYSTREIEFGKSSPEQIGNAPKRRVARLRGLVRSTSTTHQQERGKYGQLSRGNQRRDLRDKRRSSPAISNPGLGREYRR